MILVTDHLRHTLTAVEELGGAIPPELSDIITAMQKVRDDLYGADPARIITDTLDKGRPITSAIVRQAAAEQAARQAMKETEHFIEAALGSRFGELIRGTAGEQLIDSLRPRFDQAAQAMADLLYPENVTPDALVDLDPDAIQQWRSIRPHREWLDQLVDRVLIPLREQVEMPTGSGTASQFVPLITSCWLSARPATTMEQVRMYKRSDTRDPAGRWHALAGSLVLNGPAKLQEIFDQAKPNFIPGHSTGFPEIPEAVLREERFAAFRTR